MAASRREAAAGERVRSSPKTETTAGGRLHGSPPERNIAGHLVVTLDTVKKHVSHVLGKLGAANRTEAVPRGRELGLIG
jgi:Bacterial regulatory proteins, luxR family